MCEKCLWGAILLIAVLALPLSAQSRVNNKVFVSPAAGGDQSAKSYFNSKLPEAVRQCGYESADKREASDYTITVTVQEDKGVNTVALALYNTKTKEQIATFAMAYRVLASMDNKNRYLINVLMSRANSARSSTTGEIADGGTAKGGNKTQLKPDSESKSKPEPESASGSAPLYWLYLGVRGGYSARFYTPPGEYIVTTKGHSFEAGIRAAGQVLPWLAIQAEGVFTNDMAFYEKSEIEFKSLFLMFPLVVKLTFRPGQWQITPFGGAYMSVPLGKMKVSPRSTATDKSTDEHDWEWDKGMGLGWTAGLEVGRRMGPGTLFLDIRYSADLADTVLVFDTAALWRRAGVTVSLGYDFGLLRKKR